MQRLLLVEDDRMLGDALAAALAQDGWSIDRAEDAAAARLALVDHGYTAVLLDLGLPRGSGLDVLAALRQRYDTTPVLIITARDQLSDRVRGLDAGADDYIVKPFEAGELGARLRAVVRRTQGRVAPVLRHGDIVLDPADRSVRQGDRPVRLGVHEYRTLLALMERPGRVIARETLESLVYGGDGAIESNTIAVYIHQLRKKLGDGVIATVHGFGYRLGDGE
ncbi:MULTISPECIES: response regulator transcription factor [unclassified Pseudoxanthomonas]|uniref:response regulator transcription factor n=1 Tax=unclassified Pseudoxanthomonas TaxID=2645906 RepID=UPI0008F3E26B|nr:MULTISPECIES: response regulator transcription factor [unclassified Pseudoxanthomonas]SFV36203.1 two component transcriptional regulator, winged helix family [Pseudoxanthomonas sp. YR558]